MSDDTLTIADAHRAGYCIKGIREWHSSNGRDFRDFVRNGIPMKEAEQIDDAFVQHLVRLKRGKA